MSVMIYSPIKSLESWLFIALNSSQINQSMLTWIAINDLLEDRTASTEDNLVSFELSLIIRDQRDVCISSLLVEIFEHHLEML